MSSIYLQRGFPCKSPALATTVEPDVGAHDVFASPSQNNVFDIPTKLIIFNCQSKTIVNKLQNTVY